MRKIITLLIALIALSCSDDTKKVNQYIQDFAISNKLDRRTSIFDLKAKKLDGKLYLTGETNQLKIKQDLLNFANRDMGILLADKTIELPKIELGEKVFAVINISVANMRKTANLDDELINQVVRGTVIKLYKNEGKWFLIQTPDGYLGWVHQNAFVRKNKKEIESYEKAERVIVRKRLSFAYNPSNLEIASDIIESNQFELDKELKDYYQIKTATNKILWIKKEDAQLYSSYVSSISQAPKEIVKTAKKYLGVNYLWGGTSAKGLDCSGFAKTVYQWHGVELQRDASMQEKQGTEVDISNLENLREGDLLFFGKYKNKQKRVSHVAIYIGNTEYIHCASAAIRINSLDSSKTNFSNSFYKKFIAAKRYVD